MKFKVGQSVIVTEDFKESGEQFVKGMKGKVVEVSPGTVGIEWEEERLVFHSAVGTGKNQHCWSIGESFFQYLKTIFTKADLRNGDVIEYRNTTKRLAFELSGVFHFMDKDFNENNDSNDYSDDLIRTNRNKDFDIVKVYRPEDVMDSLNMKGELIFEQEEEIREITLQEVADLFGIPLSQVRIKE